jgi:predicted O-methyltransferase YrrM
MAILSEQVERYLNELRPQRAPVMAEMEELAARDGVPIVHWETGRLLAAICRAMVVTLERDTARADQARDFFARAGVADRVELVEGDARETIPALEGPFDLLFVDATKTEYREYIELAEPKLRERALLVVDNLLMGGDVAAPPSVPTTWPDESLASARELNSELVSGRGWVGCVLAVGDGIGVAARV